MLGDTVYTIPVTRVAKAIWTDALGPTAKSTSLELSCHRVVAQLIMCARDSKSIRGGHFEQAGCLLRQPSVLCTVYTWATEDAPPEAPASIVNSKRLWLSAERPRAANLTS